MAMLFNLLKRTLYLWLLSLYIFIRLSLRLLLGKTKRDAIWNSFSVLNQFRSSLAVLKFCLPIPITRPSLSIFSKKKVKIICLTNDCPFINDMWIEIWELNVYEKFFEIKAGSVVIDVGAHIGIFSIKASKKTGEEGLIIALEPHPITYALLLANLKNNKCRNAIPLNIAASDFRARAKLYLHHHSGGHSLALKRSDRYVKVHVDTLDNVVRKLGLERVDLIKVDAEGAGLSVLRGAEETLEKFRPHLSIAVYHTPAEKQGVLEFLASKEYKVSEINSSYAYAS